MWGTLVTHIRYISFFNNVFRCLIHGCCIRHLLLLNIFVIHCINLLLLSVFLVVFSVFLTYGCCIRHLLLLNIFFIPSVNLSPFSIILQLDYVTFEILNILEINWNIMHKLKIRIRHLISFRNCGSHTIQWLHTHTHNQ